MTTITIPSKPLPEIPLKRGEIILGTQKGRYCEKWIWDGSERIPLTAFD